MRLREGWRLVETKQSKTSADASSASRSGRALETPAYLRHPYLISVAAFWRASGGPPLLALWSVTRHMALSSFDCSCTCNCGAHGAENTSLDVCACLFAGPGARSAFDMAELTKHQSKGRFVNCVLLMWRTRLGAKHAADRGAARGAGEACPPGASKLTSASQRAKSL